jgi:hypothetical protein
MSRRSARRGFTLREMFVVIAGICVLLAVAVPWIQTSREAARRTDCNARLRSVANGLQQYHDVYLMFPMGAIHSGPNPGDDPPINARMGPSWWFGWMPFMESRNWYEGIQASQRPGHVAASFSAADMDVAALLPMKSIRHPDMRCASSPLPEMETPTGPIVLASYVGIAGGCDIDPNSQDYQVSGGAPAGLVAPNTDKIYHNQFKGTGGAAGGVVTPSGLLPPCQHVSLNDCPDGATNTMIVGEQSDWLLDQNLASSRKYHGDPGWTVGGTGPGGGWLSGTRRVDPVPKVDTPGGPPAIWGADCWNITTVRYAPNFKRVMGPTPLPGCSENHGINNPLQSPHLGGLQAAMADGSVRFISQTTDLGVLLRMAIRDDGVSPTLP